LVRRSEAEFLLRRARAFLETAEHLYSRGVYDIAAFSLEQAVQLMLKYRLLVATGSYPRTNSLRALFRALIKHTHDRDLESFYIENINVIGDLESAYIAARYLPVEFEKREVENMLAFARELFEKLEREPAGEAQPGGGSAGGRGWYFENIGRVVEVIRAVLDERFERYEVYLFGSVAEGDYTMASDIDILVVSDDTPRRVSERSEILARIYGALGLDVPVEVHLVDRGGFEWYKRFMRKYVRLYPSGSVEALEGERALSMGGAVGYEG